MKTLFEKLKPEVAELLMLESEMYPTITQDLIDELKSKHFFTELTVGDASQIVQLKNIRFSIYELMECFENEN